jgi:hypothetical protein
LLHVCPNPFFNTPFTPYIPALKLLPSFPPAPGGVDGPPVCGACTPLSFGAVLEGTLILSLIGVGVVAPVPGPEPESGTGAGAAEGKSYAFHVPGIRATGRSQVAVRWTP